MNITTKQQVLSVFKKLHQTCKVVFEGDRRALEASRRKINEEFKINTKLSDASTIKEQLQYAKEVEEILRKSILQAVRTESGNYRANIREDLELLDSAKPYTPMPDHMIGPFAKKKKCTSDNE